MAEENKEIETADTADNEKNKTIYKKQFKNKDSLLYFIFYNFILCFYAF